MKMQCGQVAAHHQLCFVKAPTTHQKPSKRQKGAMNKTPNSGRNARVTRKACSVGASPPPHRSICRPSSAKRFRHSTKKKLSGGGGTNGLPSSRFDMLPALLMRAFAFFLPARGK